MITFDEYSNEKLMEAARNLKRNIKVSDFPVLEQIERTARKRGLDPTAEDFGPDLIGAYIKALPGVQ